MITEVGLHVIDLAGGSHIDMVRRLTTLPRKLDGLALSHERRRVNLRAVGLGSDSSGRNNSNSRKSLSVHCVEGEG